MENIKYKKSLPLELAPLLLTYLENVKPSFSFIKSENNVGWKKIGDKCVMITFQYKKKNLY